MKKKLGMYLICLIYIFELIYTMSAMYFNSFMVTHKIEIFENIYQIAYCMIFIVGILYILLLIYKVGHHESIDLKKNTGLLFGIVFMDLVLYGFFIIPMLVSSPAMKMVCICFLVHLLVYIKEKQLFVLGEQLLNTIICDLTKDKNIFNIFFLLEQNYGGKLWMI